MNIEKESLALASPATGQKLGIDIGRVILAGASDVRYSIFSSENYLQTELMPGAVEAISALITHDVFDELYLVSKSTPRIQARTLEILFHRNFFDQTGIHPENTLFCTQSIQKAEIAKSLGLTHFIDDRQPTLRLLPESVRTKLLFVGSDDEYVPRQLFGKQSPIKPVYGWLNAYYALLDSTSIE